jgi:MFS transporter, PPP family, 3-phenylpropionic acid transporter
LTACLPAPEWAFLVQPLHAVSFGLVWLSSLEVVRRSSEAHTLGSAQGLFMAANATGSVFGILAWGPLYAARGGASVFLLAAGVASAATAAGYGLVYRGANQPRTERVDKSVSLR